MTQPDNSEHTRRIGWNGLQLTQPQAWDVIVSGPYHLLVEQNFQPVIEIRWEQGAEKSRTDIFDLIKRSFARTSDTNISKVNLPKALAPLSQSCGLTGLSWDPGHLLTGLLWQCATCQTVVFCHLYQHPKISATHLLPVLESVRCHSNENTPALWSVQDFQLRIPSFFTFSDYTFAAGLSRLAFQGDNLNLQFCRLAPATQRLVDSSLEELLGTLQGDLLYDETLTETTTLYERRNNPPSARQLLTRLRRRPPFCWGRIWYNEADNRILAVTAESKSPIDLNTVHSLCAQYEIIQFHQTPRANNQQG